MNMHHTPTDELMILNFRHLELTLQRLLAPDQGKKIQEMVEELKIVNRTLGPREATYELIALTVWLAEDGTSSGGN